MSLTPADLLAAYALVRAAADRHHQPHLHALADRLLAEHDRTAPDHTAAIAEKAREWRDTLDPSVSVADHVAAGDSLIAAVDAERARTTPDPTPDTTREDQPS